MGNMSKSMVAILNMYIAFALLFMTIEIMDLGIRSFVWGMIIINKPVNFV
jgi:uncharacterized MAPEG superfamily protein